MTSGRTNPGGAQRRVAASMATSNHNEAASRLTNTDSLELFETIVQIREFEEQV